MRLRAGALQSLTRLRRLQLRSIDTLTLEGSSVSAAGAAPLAVTVDSVRQLSVEARAFADWGRPGSSVTLRDIRQCSVAGGAFSAGDAAVPSIALERVASLSLEPAAFAADVAELRLSRVTVTRCRGGTFAGTVGTLTLDRVTLHRAERGCLRAHRWGALTVTASQLGYVSVDSFSGEVGDVQLRDSSVRRLDEGAVSLNVTRFTATGCSFGELRPRSLQIAAERSVALRDCTVGTLRQDAFRLLRLDGDSPEGVAIQRLRIDRADTGALRFADSALAGGVRNASDVDSDGDSGSRVSLSELDFGMPCACGARERAHRLLLSEGEDLHRYPDREHPLTPSILNATCAANADDTLKLSLAEFELRQCAGLMSSPAQLSGAGSGPQYYTAVAAPPLLLLLLVGAVASLLWRRRRAWRGSAASKVVWVIPSDRSAIAPAAPRVSSRDRPAAGTPAGDDRAPPPRGPPDHVTPEPAWAYVRPQSYDSIDGLYAEIRELATAGEARSAGASDPLAPTLGSWVGVGAETGTAAGKEAEMDSVAGSRTTCSESVYDVVQGPPVAVCTCRSRGPGSASDSESSLYAKLCTCRPRKVDAGRRLL